MHTDGSEPGREQFWIRLIAFAFILGGSFLFGCLARPTEMALAIVAGSIALAFSHIDKIQEFKGAGFEAKMWEQQKRELAPILAKETEPPPASPSPAFAIKAFGTDADTKKVIRALASEKYAWRYLGGIKVDTGLAPETIQKALDWLKANGLATETLGKAGPVWGLTSEGRAFLAAIDAASLPSEH